MKKLIFLLCLFNVFSIYSEPYIIKKLGMEKGLSNNYITDIAEDKNGPADIPGWYYSFMHIA